MEENHCKGNVNAVFKSDGLFCLFKLIGFCCREELNPNSLIQSSNISPVQLTKTHKIMIYIYIYMCVCVCVFYRVSTYSIRLMIVLFITKLRHQSVLNTYTLYMDFNLFYFILNVYMFVMISL